MTPLARQAWLRSFFNQETFSSATCRQVVLHHVHSADVIAMIADMVADAWR